METFMMEAAAVASTAVASTTVEGEAISADGAVDGTYTEGTLDPALSTGVETKDPLLSSWPFVIGISAAVLVVSIALGAFLAKRKIKKGIDLYED